MGRDVESMIRDLTEISIDMVRAERWRRSPTRPSRTSKSASSICCSNKASSFDPSIDVIGAASAAIDSYNRTREKFRQQLREGKLDARIVELEVRERNFPSFEIYTNQGIEEMDMNLKDMMPGLFGGAPNSAGCASTRRWST